MLFTYFAYISVVKFTTYGFGSLCDAGCRTQGLTLVRPALTTKLYSTPESCVCQIKLNKLSFLLFQSQQHKNKLIPHLLLLFSPYKVVFRSETVRISRFELFWKTYCS